MMTLVSLAVWQHLINSNTKEPATTFELTEKEIMILHPPYAEFEQNIFEFSDFELM